MRVFRILTPVVSLFVIFSHGSALAAYCTASGGGDEYIYQVQVGTINNNATPSSHYADYSATHSTVMEPSTLYIVNIVTAVAGIPYKGYPGDQLGIWVDWNEDEDFTDAGETAYAAAGYGFITTTITPPAGTPVGSKRMRIRLTYTGTLDPCGNTTWGEVEDYTIIIQTENNGSISGTKFWDTDGNSRREAYDPDLAGWEIFLDNNGNGVWNVGEPKTTTNAGGYYEFTGLAAGTYTVAEVQQSGWHQTFPGSGGRYTESLDAGETLTDRNFGNRQISDTLVVIPATADTYVSNANPTTNYGSAVSFSSGKTSTAITRAFLKFDLSGIPAGQVVTRAKLRLESAYISFPNPELAVYRMADNWEESTLNWNTQPEPFYYRSIILNTQVVDSSITVWDVTDIVDDDYVAGGAFSVMIQSYDEDLFESASFWSKEFGVPEIAPKLEVEYAPMAGGGTGTPEDPYQIYTGEQMNRIGLYKNRWAKYYDLMSDISLAAYSGSLYNIIGASTSAQFGAGPFDGTFDGNFHSITGFSFSNSSDSYVGLFGCIGTRATVKNLKIISPSLTDPGLDDMKYVGPLAGYVYGGNVSDCTVIGGTVQGKEYVGGLVGVAAGYITACSSSATVSGAHYVGGLVGGPPTSYGMGGISNSYARGNVSGTSHVGGFIGDSSDVTIASCYSTGNVTGTSDIGGFSGYNLNNYLAGIENVTACLWDTTTSGTIVSAAGTGLETTAMQYIDTFLDADWDFADEIDNGASNDWAMPAGGGYPVLWHELPVPPDLPSFAGGAGTIGDPYLIANEQHLNSIGHNARLMDKHFRLTNNLHFHGLKYYMIAETPYEFSGTFDGFGHTISNLVIKPVFRLSSAGFIATLKGENASIKDLTLIDPNTYADWGQHVGTVVGRNYSATITNCHVTNTNVWGLTSVGGLVGINYAEAIISGCSATGHVAESASLAVVLSAAGGLVGENSYLSEIANSFAFCTVSGNDCLGGLVGSNLLYGTVTNCFAKGAVTGTSTYVGGLIGRNLGGTLAEYCYSTALVTGPTGTNSVGGFVGKMGTTGSEHYTACFWDSEINAGLPGIGNVTEPNVVGETTSNLKDQNTFTSEGWDFAGEAANGTDDIWKICQGADTPKLWQISNADFTCPDGVDTIDLAVLAGQWLQSPAYPSADIAPRPNGDGVVDFLDFAILAHDWLFGLQ